MAEDPKLLLLPGGSETSCTFVLAREDHTLGNALRYVCMRDARTSFCGYSMPHPSEQVVNLRLQTLPPATSLDVFTRSLQTLVDVCEHIEGALDAAQAPAMEEEEEEEEEQQAEELAEAAAAAEGAGAAAAAGGSRGGGAGAGAEEAATRRGKRK